MPIVTVIATIFYSVHISENPCPAFCIIEDMDCLVLRVTCSIRPKELSDCLWELSTTYIFLFICLEAYLEKTGIGAFFIDLANAIAGHTAGGPAKVLRF